MKKTIKIFDTTLRDGEQSPGCSMDIQEKVKFAEQLEKLNVDVIEAGFPIASHDDFQSIQMISKKCKQTEICALSRATEMDIKCAWDSLKYATKPRIHTFIATSEIHMKYKLKKTKSQILNMAVNAVKYAKSLCNNVDFSPEDATRSDHDFLFKIIEAVIDAGADTINIPDTVGYSIPEEFGSLIKDIIKNVPNISKAIISTHCHNDLGMATANSLTGIINGASQVECTINGIGERAGNAALEEIVMALKTRNKFFDVRTNINTTEIYKSSQLLSKIIGIQPAPNKAIVGKNAFAHESGIHQDGILKNKTTYEIMTPQDIGIEKNKIVLGKHSGRHAIINRLTQLGIEISKDDINTIFHNFKELADRNKTISDEDLIELANK